MKDANYEMKLNLSSYEDIVKQLDLYYGIVKRQILAMQNAVSGLFPVLSNEDVVGSVRESIYCAAAIWSLYQAYRRIDDDRGKSHELGQSAVKCMRGILNCWTRQSHRVEKFKTNQSSKYALHCKFNMNTGEEIYSDDTYSHLQIDVVSLYLLFLVQMISSGLQIIYTQAEVAFVQNLVYYVERAYRTPDFGMWERGTKYNDGTPEIHASSIGMAKSALEAINGCNLFGDKGASWSVIYVDIDAHNRNRSIFETLLPRESSSKAIDASLIPTISFPAFATHDSNLCALTKSRVVKSLCGRYGFKRFSRDGYKCLLEAPNRRFYNVGETKEFEGLECEWPQFFLHMIIDGVFHNDAQQVERFQILLNKVMQKDCNGDPVIPMYFFVSQDRLEGMREECAVPKEASEEGSPSGPIYLLNQALFVIASLLTCGLLHLNELDPIRRYLPSFNRPKKTGRYSAFQAKPVAQTGSATDLVVQIVLIAESMRLQAMMATYGIQTQTPHEVEPVQIWSSNQLVKVYQYLGINTKLGTSGRPTRPIGALGTSKIYRVCGMTVLCYPLIFEVSNFYLYRDLALLIDDIKTELQFVSRYWRLSGRPTICLLIREEHMRDAQFNEMLDLLAMLKKGCCEGVKVRIGRLQNLISSSCIEHLDFMNTVDTSELEFQPFKQLVHDYIGYQSLTDVSKASAFSEELENLMMYEKSSVNEILEVLRYGPGMYARAQLYGILLDKVGLNYQIHGRRVEELLESLYNEAGSLHYWRVVRYCSSLLGHTVDSISPFITAVLVNGKQITVGVVGHEETVFDKPMTPQEIRSVMYSTVRPHNVVQAVLQQEIVLYCGRLIATNSEIFKGVLKIRVGWVIEAMRLYLEMRSIDASTLDNLSPFEIRLLLHKIFTVREWASHYRLSPLEKRKLEGCLSRVPPDLYDNVWNILTHTPQGIRVQGHTVPQQPTISNMTRSELKFALLVEETLHHILKPEYRQIIVELLCIVATILMRNPELSFCHQLDLDQLVSEAFNMFCKDHNVGENEGLQVFFSKKPSVTTGYLARAVVNILLKGGDFNISPYGSHMTDKDYCTVS